MPSQDEMPMIAMMRKSFSLIVSAHLAIPADGYRGNKIVTG